MDIKSLVELQWEEVRNLIYYITDYMTKLELRTYNFVNLLSNLKQRIEMEEAKGLMVTDAVLVQRLLNKINVETETSAPMAALSLLGFDDHFKSHETCYLNLNSVLFEMNLAKIPNKDDDDDDVAVDDDDDDDGNVEDGQDQCGMQVDESGNVVFVSHKVDYRYRAAELDNLSLYEFTSNFKKKKEDPDKVFKSGGPGPMPLDRHRFLPNILNLLLMFWFGENFH